MDCLYFQDKDLRPDPNDAIGELHSSLSRPSPKRVLISFRNIQTPAMADKIKSLFIDETLRFAESGTNVAKSGAYLYPVKVNKHPTR